MPPRRPRRAHTSSNRWRANARSRANWGHPALAQAHRGPGCLAHAASSADHVDAGARSGGGGDTPHAVAAAGYDLLVVVREFLNPSVSRSGLDRCLRRHGVAHLRELMPEAEGERAAKKTFKDYVPGFLHIDIKYLPQMRASGIRRLTAGRWAQANSLCCCWVSISCSVRC